MMDEAPMQAEQTPEPANNLQRQVVSMLKENLSIPPTRPIEVRQAPINGDDHDSWASSEQADAFDNLASELIELIQGDNSNETESSTED